MKVDIKGTLVLWKVVEKLRDEYNRIIRAETFMRIDEPLNWPPEEAKKLSIEEIGTFEEWLKKEGLVDE